MIKSKTVLILGAGASYSFNFPLGPKLVDDILEFIKTPYDDKRLALAKEVTSTNDDTLNEFHDALKYSGKISIDTFLESRHEFMGLGKALIACVLCRSERKDNIFSARSGTRSNWYYYLFDKMGSTLSEIEGSINNLAIITFNYDRSLEYFLYHALMNSYRLNADTCRGIISNLNLIHFYGLLGELSELNPKGRRFRNELGEDGLIKCIEGIKIIREGETQADGIKRAHEYLEIAKRIIFLGFGYDRTNLRRLKIKDIIHSKSDSFSGTAYNLKRFECMNIIQESFGLSTGRHIYLDHKNGEILAYLHSHTPFDDLWSGHIPDS